MRKTREIRRFARWCFGRLDMRPIPIYLINAPSLIDPGDNYCFGCYTYGEGKAEEGKIFIAYKLPKWSVMINVAHEIWHHYQNVQGTIRTMTVGESEADAEKGSEALLGVWFSRVGRGMVVEKKWRVDDGESVQSGRDPEVS